MSRNKDVATQWIRISRDGEIRGTPVEAVFFAKPEIELDIVDFDPS
jgi:hypothetical protein